MGRQSADFKQKIALCAHSAGAWVYARIRVLTAIDAFISIRLDLGFEAASSWVTGTWSLFDFKGKVVQHMSKLSKQVSADAIRGVLGMLPTPATSDANDWACTQSVDLDETERMAKMVVDAGVSILITAGSFGEGASLTWSEHQLLTDCLVQSVGARSLIFAGATTLNTRDTIERGRALVALGADGLFLGRPMWMSLDQIDIVRFYSDVAEALPGVPIIIYDNALAFKSKITTSTYEALARNPSIVATKHIGGPAMADDLRAVGKSMRMLPVDSQWAGLARDFPDDAVACWSGNVADGPEPLAVLEQAIVARDWGWADRICARLEWAQSAMFPGGKIENFVDYNVPIARARLEGSGLIKSGPPRPPYFHAPEDYWEGGRETGRRWAQLRDEIVALPEANNWEA